MDPHTVQEIKPLVIRTPDGEIFDVSLMNPKSHSKSIERDQLWHLHRQTGRTLPYDERHELRDLKARENWYEAVVSYAPESSENGVRDANTGWRSESREFQGMEIETPAALRRQSGEVEAAGSCGDVLERLEAIVQERRETMPEGSYTTHLFASGAEKIRKKAGEEAVELILANSPDQIVYEAADMLYHLCVLLVSEGISYSEVCAELRRRHTDG
ncbi:MAG: phosphoribosyl-ATP diphosphatase [Spirochaetia bacterium]